LAITKNKAYSVFRGRYCILNNKGAVDIKSICALKEV
jgi:hypothetical protein